MTPEPSKSARHPAVAVKRAGGFILRTRSGQRSRIGMRQHLSMAHLLPQSAKGVRLASSLSPAPRRLRALRRAVAMKSVSHPTRRMCGTATSGTLAPRCSTLDMPKQGCRSSWWMEAHRSGPTRQPIRVSALQTPTRPTLRSRLISPTPGGNHPLAMGHPVKRSPFACDTPAGAFAGATSMVRKFRARKVGSSLQHP